MKLTVVIPAGKNSELSVIESLKNQSEKPFQVIVARGAQASRNRNRGIEQARGDFIAFVNSHSSFPSDWVFQIRRFFENYPSVDVVGGPQLTPPGSGFFEKISGYALTSKFGAANVAGRYKKGKLNLNAGETDITSSNLICRRGVLAKVRFNENLWPGEDPKFICDAKASGFRVAYCPDIVGYNQRRGSSAGLMKQFFNYGKFRPRFSSVLKNPLFLIPGLFFLYVLFLVLFSVGNLSLTGNVIGGGLIGSVLVIPLIAYIFLALLFGIIDGFRNSDLRGVLVLPFVYPMIHLSYGAGLVLGILRKFI